MFKFWENPPLCDGEEIVWLLEKRALVDDQVNGGGGGSGGDHLPPSLDSNYISHSSFSSRFFGFEVSERERERARGSRWYSYRSTGQIRGEKGERFLFVLMFIWYISVKRLLRRCRD